MNDAAKELSEHVSSALLAYGTWVAKMEIEREKNKFGDISARNMNELKEKVAARRREMDGDATEEDSDSGE